MQKFAEQQPESPMAAGNGLFYPEKYLKADTLHADTGLKWADGVKVGLGVKPQYCFGACQAQKDGIECLMRLLMFLLDQIFGDFIKNFRQLFGQSSLLWLL